MADTRKHRGAHPEDALLFAPAMWPRLREAVADLSYLLGRGYTEKAALKLVGDRFALTERQRTAVWRAACSDAAQARRRAHECPPEQAAGAGLWIDGFNLITTIEVALSGGVLLRCRDGCYRDMASLHGSYRKVEETAPALLLIGEVLAGLGVGPCTFLLDSPVSNSGRLALLIRQAAAQRGWDWTVEVVPDPDRRLKEPGLLVATADSAILDRCSRWLALSRLVVQERVPGAYVVDLG